MLTPHSENAMILRPSGAHSALKRPSTPDSIFAVQSSSRKEYTLTIPRFAQHASIYVESVDQPIWVIHASFDFPDALDVEGPAIISFEAAGDVLTSQVRVI